METWDEKRNIARFSWQNAVFCEESFSENRALYIPLAYKDVDRFRKGSVHELYCLKASQLETFSWDNAWADRDMISNYENTDKKSVVNDCMWLLLLLFRT